MRSGPKDERPGKGSRLGPEGVGDAALCQRTAWPHHQLRVSPLQTPPRAPTYAPSDIGLIPTAQTIQQVLGGPSDMASNPPPPFSVQILQLFPHKALIIRPLQEENPQSHSSWSYRRTFILRRRRRSLIILYLPLTSDQTIITSVVHTLRSRTYCPSLGK